MHSRRRFIRRGGQSVVVYEINDGGVSPWREISKDEFERLFPTKPLHVPEVYASWNKEVISVGAGVTKKQIKEAEEHCRKHGIPTDFSTNGGLPIFTSRAHRKQVLKLMRLHDNEGGYGD